MELETLPFLRPSNFYGFLTQENFGLTCSFNGLGLKSGFAANLDMSLPSFSCAAYCSIKFPKKAIKGKLLKKKKREREKK